MVDIDPEFGKLVEDLVLSAPALPPAQVVAIDPLAGDASSRQYFRVKLSGTVVPAAILMRLSQAAGPVGGGSRELTQDDTFVEIQSIFAANDIRVPDILADGRKHNLLLVEDIGELPLWSVAAQDSKALEDAERALSGSTDIIEDLFKKAIQMIGKMQAIPPDNASLIYERTPSIDKYRREAAECGEYLLTPRGLRPSEMKVLEGVQDAVAESIMAHPFVPCHFDYMAYNIYVLPDGELCLIDFQDASAVSPVRDIVSLLNDRDMDSHLGQSRHGRLLSFFAEELMTASGYTAENIKEWYNHYLLHWDLRVSGRFALLSEQRGVDRYAAWIPGTMRRLGRTLLRVERDFPGVADLLSFLPQYVPEVKEGIEDPWEVFAK